MQGQPVQGTGVAAAEDPEIKSLQNQVAELQKRIQSLSEDDSIDPKAKSEKKQELQKQIASLNAQIRQRRIQTQRERRSAAEKAENNVKSGKRFEDGFDKNDAHDIISASNSLKKSQSTGSVIKKSEGRARILNAEIESDKARGADTSVKEKELEKLYEHTETAKEGLAEKNGGSEDEDISGIKDKPEEYEERKGSVAVNVGKRNRQIASSKCLSQIQMVIALVQKDISDCKNGKQQGMCDDDEVAKAEALLKQAQEKMSQIRSQSAEEQEEGEKDLSFYTTLLL